MASIWSSIFGGAKKKKKELLTALGPPGKKKPGGKYPYGSAPYYDPAPSGSSKKKKATVAKLDRPSGRKPKSLKKKKNEIDFQKWYANQAISLGLNPDPDDIRHYYDWRSAYRAGAEPDILGHWPSAFKLEGHPNLIIGGIDTRTGQPYRKGFKK